MSGFRERLSSLYYLVDDTGIYNHNAISNRASPLDTKLLQLLLHYWVYSIEELTDAETESPATLPRCMGILSSSRNRQLVEESINWSDPLAARPDDVYLRSIRLLHFEERLHEPLFYGIVTIDKLVTHYPEMMHVKVPGSPNLLDSIVKACKRQSCFGGDNMRTGRADHICDPLVCVVSTPYLTKVIRINMLSLYSQAYDHGRCDEGGRAQTCG